MAPPAAPGRDKRRRHRHPAARGWIHSLPNFSLLQTYTPHHATASARSFVSSRLVDRPTGVTPRKAYGTQGLREGRFNLYYSTRFIWR